MVTYQRWTSIAHEVAERKGARLDTLAANAAFVDDVVSTLWNRNKEQLSTATIAEARSFAEDKITA